MNKLLQTPPLKVLGQAGIGKVRQHKQEPLVPNLWSKRTRLDIHMYYHFGQLELLLTKWEKLKFLGLEQDPMTKKLWNQANTITDTIRHSWNSYDIKDESEIQEYIVRSGIKTLYPRAVHYALTNDTNEGITLKEGPTMQLHYHQMALLGQVLATCDCILASLNRPDRLLIAHLLAFLYQCLNMQQQPPFVDYRARIEQRFEEIKNTPSMDKDQTDWIKALVSDIHTYVQCYSAYRYQPLRDCSSVFDVMKQSTARP